MSRCARTLSLFAAAAACSSLLACVPGHSVTIGRRAPAPAGPPIVREDPGNGPPPWAPAHGYRHKHQHAYRSRPDTVDLVFDSGLGVYAVVGIPNYYYWNGVYIRISGDQWWRAPYLDASWEPCDEDALPGKLRYTSHDDDKGHGKKGHGKHKGKGHRQEHGAADRDGD
jgi:hypothetical protein